jgi:MscS family membrane protein
MLQTDLWIEALVGITLLLIVGYGIKQTACLIEKHSHGSVQKKLYQIVRLPLKVLLWFIGITYIIDIVGHRIGFWVAVDYIQLLRRAVVVGCIAWLLFRWKDELQKSILSSPTRKIDPTTLQMLGRLSTIAIVILSALIVLQIFGFNIAPLLAFGSIGAASLGFASKDVMANLCSSVMLQISRPFVVGDEILLPEKNLQGHIEEIGWFKTLIRDKEKRSVYLPNNLFATTLVVNISRMTHRRIRHILKLPLEAQDQIQKVIADIHSLLKQSTKIDHRLPCTVHFHTFGEYSLELEIEAYSMEIDIHSFHAFQEQLLLDIFTILKTHQISPAIPSFKLLQG